MIARTHYERNIMNRVRSYHELIKSANDVTKNMLFSMKRHRSKPTGFCRYQTDRQLQIWPFRTCSNSSVFLDVGVKTYPETPCFACCNMF